MKWLDKYFKEKVVPEITRLEECTSDQAPNISEPVYAIARATRDKLNRWKFDILGNQIIIEDKHTGRSYLFDKGYQIKFTGYENVFNKDEKLYLQNSFQKLMDRKIEQAKRVHDRYVYRAEIRKKDIEKNSIRAGLEIRAKILEEYK